MLQVGQIVTVIKGNREIWTHFTNGRPARYAPVAIRAVYRISAIEDVGRGREVTGGGCKISMHCGNEQIRMFTSARAKLARREIVLNTGDPTKTIRVLAPDNNG